MASRRSSEPSRPDYSPSRGHARLLARRPAHAWDGEPIAAWQRKLRRILASALGLPGMQVGLPGMQGGTFDPRALAASPPRARTLWRRDWALPERGRLGTITKIELAMEPGVRAPAYLCLPPGPMPERFVVCLQGHTTGMHNSIGMAADETTPIDVPGDRDFAMHCVARGFGALALEQRSLGERREARQARKSFHNDCHDAAMRALLVGRTLLGERVFDVLRAVSWLRARARPRGGQGAGAVGVLGNSGGGTVATMAGALDPAIDFVVTSCSFSTIAASIATIHHCSDNYIPGMLTIADTGDLGGLCAPRPLVVVAGKTDPIFPLAGARAAIAATQRIYAAAGASPKLRFVIGDGAHRFYARDAFTALDEVLGNVLGGVSRDVRRRRLSSAR